MTGASTRYIRRTDWLTAYAEDHPLIDRGVAMDEACTLLLGKIVAVSVDWPAMSPRQANEQAKAAEGVCAAFAAAGITAICPGALLHRLAALRPVLGGPHTEGGALWSAPLLRACGALYVPASPGWRVAGGVVAREAAYMLGRNCGVLTEVLP